MKPAVEDYANVTGRTTSTFLRIAATLSKGVASVQRQHAQYAQQWYAANHQALTEPGPRWIVFGDSMSQAAGASSFDSGWVNQLQQRLYAEGGLQLPIVNLSAGGARVTDVLSQQLPAWRDLPPARGAHADLVTVLIGSNDLMSKARRAALPTAFAQLLGQLPAGAVVATLPQPRQAAKDVNTLLASGAEAGTINVVDLRASGPASWRGKLAADHFHPNDLGYAAIAEAFYEPVRHALGLTGAGLEHKPDRYARLAAVLERKGPS